MTASVMSLRRTLEEIFQHNDRVSNPLAVLKTINRLTPRSWTYSISSPDGHLVLSIKSSPAIRLEEFLSIMDGSIPELFSCTTIKFRSDNSNNISINVSNLALANTLDIVTTGSPESGEIQLHEFWSNVIHPCFSDQDQLSRYTKRHTYLGSVNPTFEIRKSEISVKCMLDEVIIEYDSRHNVDSADSIEFSHRFNVETPNCGNCTGTLLLHNSINKEKFEVFDSVFGSMENQFVLPRLSKELGVKGINGLIEFQESNLRYEADGSVGPSARVKEMQRSIDVQMHRVFLSRDFKIFKQNIVDHQVQLQAEGLVRRQEELSSRWKVYFGDRLLCCVPQSENEVIILLSKLENVGILPIHMFNLIEYTPKVGIDALANIQLNNLSNIALGVPVELENHLESFFHHGHPAEQVYMIACWDIAVANTREIHNMISIEDGLYSMDISDRKVFVLVLSECPGIRIQSN
jgi:hypothetical protein